MRRARQRGTSLVELMIAIAIGLIVILAAVALYLGGTSTLRFQDEASRLDDSGRFALESIARLIRIAGYVNWPGDSGSAPVLPGAADPPAIKGTDGATGDTITIRFYGSTVGAAADGAIVDCLGVPVPRDGKPSTRTENVLSLSAAGALWCQATGMTSPQALVDGVERLQFLYGLDLDADGRPELWVPASDVTNWHAVRAVRVALLMASAPSTRHEPDSAVYQLFGPGYSNSADGAVLDASKLSAAERRRLRRVYSTVVTVRNGG